MFNRGDGRENIPWAQPEEHHRVEFVGVRDQQDRKHEEEQNVTEDKVGGEHAKLSDLAEEFTTRLRECVPAHRVPLSSPPGDVGGVSLELTGEGAGDDELEEEALNGDNSDHSRQSPGETETLEEHHDNEEDEEHEDSDRVGDGGQDSTELLAAHAKERSRATCQAEHATQDTSVDSDRAHRDDENTDQSTGLVRIVRVGILRLVARVGDTGLSVDEQ